ncbi:MAG TPA: choice-of-anchor Q domain-containing protein [Polyangiaceae bacterium]
MRKLSASSATRTIFIPSVTLSVALAGGGCDPAQIIAVTTTADSGSGSLRAAVQQANASSSGVTIQLPPGEYTLTRCGADDSASAGDLDIDLTKPVTITATGTGTVTIRQTCAGERVIDARGGRLLTLRGVTVTGGNVHGAPGESVSGGGVRAAGDVLLERAAIAHNFVTGGVGVASMSGGAASGGGLYVGGSLTAVDSAVSYNDATGGAGVGMAPGLAPGGNATGGGAHVAGTITLNRVTAELNTATGGAIASCDQLDACRPGESRGGAFASTGPGAIENSVIDGNRALASAHASCFTQYCFGIPVLAAGGGVWSSRALSLTGSNFRDNEATVSSARNLDGSARGGAVTSDVSITVNGGWFSNNLVGNGSGGALNGIQISVSDATFIKNAARGSGGAIAAERLTAVNISASENSASGSGGGAIAVFADASIQRSHIHHNTVGSQQDGGRRALAGGGGIRVGGKLTISESQVSSNTGSASYDGGYAGRFEVNFVGGGVEAGSLDGDSITVSDNKALGHSFASYGPASAGPSGGAGIVSRGLVTLVNSTIVGNETSVALTEFSVAPPFGSAIYARQLRLDHVTIADNANAPAIQAGELTSYRSVATAPADQPVCALYQDPVVLGSRGYVLLASAHNWFDDASCALAGAGDRQSDAAFLLGPLADNGGHVPTRYPAPTSVLLNQIPSSACPVVRDARGVARPQGSACEIGAVEASQ